MNPFFAKLAASFRSTPKKPSLETVILPGARDRWQSRYISSYTPELVETTLRSALNGNLVATFELYDLMESTWPRLMKNMAEIKDAVAAAEWNVQPWNRKGAEPTPEAIRRASLLENAIWSMAPDIAADEAGFRQTLRDILDAWGKGISVLEVRWAPGPNMIAPQATSWVHPRYYGYNNSGTRLQLYADEIRRSNPAAPLAAGAQWVEFPADKFLLCVAKHKSGHPLTSNLLRPLAWWWCASNFSAGWFLNFAQIFGLPIRWAQYDPNVPGLLDQVSEMLEQMGSSAWAAFPTGTQLEIKEPMRGSAEIPQGHLLDRADRQCDLLVLGQTLTSDVADSGSRALGDVHERVLSGRKKAAADFAASVLNEQLAPAFCRLNFGDATECPQFVIGGEAQEDALAMANRDKILIEAGLDMPREWFFNRHKIPMPAEGEPVVKRQAAPNPMLPPAAEDGGNPDVGGQLEAKAGDESMAKLANRVMEDLTGVSARWLSGAAPWFEKLIRAAQDPAVSDAEFEQLIVRAKASIPDELARHLKPQVVADALEAAMGASMVNGAVAGYLGRRPRRR